MKVTSSKTRKIRLAEFGIDLEPGEVVDLPKGPALRRALTSRMVVESDGEVTPPPAPKKKTKRKKRAYSSAE